MLPAIATQLGFGYSNREGWLSGLSERLLTKKHTKDLELAISFPTDEETGEITQTLELGENIPVRCFSFLENLNRPDKYNKNLEDRMQQIIAEFEPDIVHIFGTEFPHTLACVKAFGHPERTLIGIQGLCFAIAKAYSANIPLTVKYTMTIRDFLKQDGIWQQQDKFKKRGKYEIEAIKGVSHITGRTDFDRNETKNINPDATYHFMNETMRGCFYKDRWTLENCEPHSIFLSAGDYPLKGFHYVLQAMPQILEKYPDTKIYVAGANLLQNETWKDRLKRSSYGKYLMKLIKQNGLGDKVFMLGRITADEMKAMYLRSHVFVCPSSLENSPNSLGEAMLLGAPCVAANVGGIHNLLEDGQDGLLYPAGDINALAGRILEIFEKEEVTKLYSSSAKKHAHVTHSGEDNYKRLLEIYDEIYRSNNG